jgi:O-antigen/teichoic acid export membrane protein
MLIGAAAVRAGVEWLFRTGGHVRDRVVRGAAWQAIGAGLGICLGALKIVILARLLAPSDFGLFGIAAIVLHWTTHFSNAGLNAALVQHRGDIQPYLATVWTLQVLRGIGLAAVVYAVAPLGAWVFRAPDVVPVLRGMAVVVMVIGFRNPAVAYLRKELDFRRVTGWNLGTAITGGIVAVILAFVLRNVWALVIATIAAHLVNVIISYWLVPFRPSPRLDVRRALELMRFGRWVFAGHMMAFATSKLDTIIVARLLGPAVYGFYDMAKQVTVLPAHQASMQLTSLMFPAFAKLRGVQHMRRALRRALEVAGVLALPLACFMMAFAEPLVSVVLGPRWTPIAPCLPFLAFAVVAHLVSNLMGSLLMGAGRPDLRMYAPGVSLLLLAALVYPFTLRWGITGAAAAVAMANIASAVLGIVLVGRAVRQPIGEVMAALQPGVLASIPFLAAGPFAPHEVTPGLGALVTVAVGIYMAIAFRVFREQFSAGPPAPQA